MPSFHLIQTCSQKNVTKLIWNFPWNLFNQWKIVTLMYLFLQTLYEAVTSHFPATLWLFPASALLRASEHIGTTPRTILKKYTFFTQFVERFFYQVSPYIWIVFSVSNSTIGLFLSYCHLYFFNDAVGQHRKQKALEPDFCAQMSWWKSVTSHTIQTIHTMHHHHHHRHHDCFIFDIAEMYALPPSPSQWFWQKGHKRPLTSEKNDSLTPFQTI